MKPGNIKFDIYIKQRGRARKNEHAEKVLGGRKRAGTRDTREESRREARISEARRAAIVPPRPCALSPPPNLA